MLPTYVSPYGPFFFQYPALITENTLPHGHNPGTTSLFVMQSLTVRISSDIWNAVIQEELSKQYLNILFSWRMEDVDIVIFIPTPPIMRTIKMQCHSIPSPQFCTCPILCNERKSPTCWVLWFLLVHMPVSSQRQNKHIPKFPSYLPLISCFLPTHKYSTNGIFCSEPKLR